MVGVSGGWVVVGGGWVSGVWVVCGCVDGGCVSGVWVGCVGCVGCVWVVGGWSEM